MSETRTKILLVDDDDLILSALKRGLRDCKHEIITAKTLGEARRIINEQRHEILVVVTDGSLSRRSRDGEIPLEGIEIGNTAVQNGIPNVFIFTGQNVANLLGLNESIKYFAKPGEMSALCTLIKTL